MNLITGKHCAMTYPIRIAILGIGNNASAFWTGEMPGGDGAICRHDVYLLTEVCRL